MPHALLRFSCANKQLLSKSMSSRLSMLARRFDVDGTSRADHALP